MLWFLHMTLTLNDGVNTTLHCNLQYYLKDHEVFFNGYLALLTEKKNKTLTTINFSLSLFFFYLENSITFIINSMANGWKVNSMLSFQLKSSQKGCKMIMMMIANVYWALFTCQELFMGFTCIHSLKRSKDIG